VIAQMADRYAAGVPLLPGSVATVRQLAERYRLGLASSSPRALIDTVLAAVGLTEMFAVTRSTEEEERGKPAPDVYLAVAAALSAEPVDCVAVEDSTNGIRSAAAAGMVVIAIPQAAFPVDPTVLKVAACVLDRLDALPAAIEDLR
jgi:HAD superfamily hydrolase (TIGR01509 family)